MIPDDNKLFKHALLCLNEILGLFKNQDTVSEIPFRPPGGDICGNRLSKKVAVLLGMTSCLAGNDLRAFW